jgi:hypothetical protein
MKLKDSIILGGREFNSGKKVEIDFGIDHKTRKKWTELGLLPPPLRLGNCLYFDRAALEARILENVQEFCHPHWLCEPRA